MFASIILKTTVFAADPIVEPLIKLIIQPDIQPNIQPNMKPIMKPIIQPGLWIMGYHMFIIRPFELGRPF